MFMIIKSDKQNTFFSKLLPKAVNDFFMGLKIWIDVEGGGSVHDLGNYYLREFQIFLF